MKYLQLKAIALATSLVFSVGALAQAMSMTDYKAGKDRISAEYKSSKAGCQSLSGNPKDICVEEAKGREKTGKADLEASYQPSPKTRYNARLAQVEAAYEVAKEHCDDQAGNAKDVCVKEAKSVRVAGKADAKVLLKTSNANAVANEKTSDARSDATDKKVDARMDATAEKLEAQYKVEAEKCDTYAGDAKDTCVAAAKARFGQK